MKPKVCIGMPLFNAEKYLRKSLAQLLAQDYPNIEIIICDNSSTDRTKEIIEAYRVKDKRIKIYYNETNIGAAKNFIKVLDLADGKYFMWAAHDDGWEPTYIRKCVEILEKEPGVVMCGSNIRFIDKDGHRITIFPHNRLHTFQMGLQKRVRTLVGTMNWYSIYSVIRTDILKKIKLDLYCWGPDVIELLQLSLLGEFYVIPEELFHYRWLKKTVDDVMRQVDPARSDDENKMPYSSLPANLIATINHSDLEIQEKLQLQAEILQTICFHNETWRNLIFAEIPGMDKLVLGNNGQSKHVDRNLLSVFSSLFHQIAYQLKDDVFGDFILKVKEQHTSGNESQTLIKPKQDPDPPDTIKEIVSAQEKQNLPALFWHAPLFDPSGYADEARQFVLGLDKLGLKLQVSPIHWSDKIAKLSPQDEAGLKRLVNNRQIQNDPARKISVFHIFPPNFQRVPHAHYHIGRTMFETDRIPENWVVPCNQMDEIWVPSDFNIESFTKAGVAREKLVKIQGGIDLSQYSSHIKPMEIAGAGKINFLSIFDWSYRKGWDVLLRSFLKTFKGNKDICLILKVWSTLGVTITQIKDQIRSFVRQEELAEEIPDNILFVTENLSHQELISLYKTADAFVLPTRGEGWGRPFMEAMALGVPVVGTNWSGQTEFMNNDNAYLINCKVKDVADNAWREIPTFKGHRWAEPSEQHLCEILKDITENPYKSKKIGKVARAYIEQNFSQEKIAKVIQTRIEEISKIMLPTVINTNTNPVPVEDRRPKSIEKPRLKWEGSQFVTHSLALVNREHSLQLLDAGYELSVIPYEPDQFGVEADQRFKSIKAATNKPLAGETDIHIRHQWPPNLTAPSRGKWVIIQPWEFGSLPLEWAKVFSQQVDEMWVYSQYVRNVYITSGIPEDRVHVIPCGINPEKFNPYAKPYTLKTNKKFKFLFVGGTIYRKGIDVLLKAYLNAFTNQDDVCLVIKDMGGESFYRGQTFQKKIKEIKNQPQAPEVEYMDATLSVEELIGLYVACDVLVHPYRGEGFGLPILEGMACGIPAIVPQAGSCLDFCHADNALFIKAVRNQMPEKKVGDKETVNFPWMYEPDPEALRNKLQHCFAHPEEMEALGKAASAEVLEHWTWEKASRIIQRRLQELMKKPQLNQLTYTEPEAAYQSFITSGDEYFERKDYDQASECYRKAIALNVHKSQGYNNLGCIFHMQQDFQKAFDYFEKAAKLNITFEDALLNLWDAAQALGKTKDVRVVLQTALDFNPNLQSIAKCLSAPVEARQEAQPANDYLTQEGEQLAEQGDLDQATLKFLDALDMNKNDSRAYNNLGVIAWQRGSSQDSFVLFKQAVEIEPTFVDALFNLMEVSTKLGIPEKGISYMKKALGINPDLTEVNDMVEKASAA